MRAFNIFTLPGLEGWGTVVLSAFGMENVGWKSRASGSGEEEAVISFQS